MPFNPSNPCHQELRYVDIINTDTNEFLGNHNQAGRGGANFTSMHNTIILKEGWLNKQAATLPYNWKERYCVLYTDGSFNYFEDEEQTRQKHAGIDDFHGIAHVQMTEPLYFNVEVTGRRTWHFYCEDADECNSWVQAFQDLQSYRIGDRLVATDAFLTFCGQHITRGARLAFLTASADTLSVYDEHGFEKVIAKEDWNKLELDDYNIVHITMDADDVVPWGIRMNLTDSFLNWKVTKVESGSQGENCGIKAGWFILRWNRMHINLGNSEELKIELNSRPAGTITFGIPTTKKRKLSDRIQLPKSSRGSLKSILGYFWSKTPNNELVVDKWGDNVGQRRKKRTLFISRTKEQGNILMKHHTLAIQYVSRRSIADEDSNVKKMYRADIMLVEEYEGKPIDKQVALMFHVDRNFTDWTQDNYLCLQYCSLDDISEMSKNLYRSFGAYNLVSNNCQHFTEELMGQLVNAFSENVTNVTQAQQHFLQDVRPVQRTTETLTTPFVPQLQFASETESDDDSEKETVAENTQRNMQIGQVNEPM